MRVVTRYFISFDDGDMRHIPDQDFPEVGRDAHAVMYAAQAAGVWVTGGGLHSQTPTVVSPDGEIVSAPERGPFVGGYSILDLDTREEALEWAARFAAACRCAQQIREVMDDPEAEATVVARSG